MEIYERVADSVVSVNASYDGSTGYGSGIIVSEDGFIITNSHVIFDSRDSVVSVKLHNGEQYGAVVIGYERNADLAVLRIEAENLQAAEFGDSSALRVGEQVFAIGSPGGERYSNTLTGGYVSGLNRELDKTVANGLTYIQTDAAVNPGNSGGALVNAWGQVVGINSNKVVSASYEALGFAIPISDAASMLNDLLHYGYVTGRSRLGVTAQTVTQMQAELSGVPVGVLLVSIENDSPLAGRGQCGRHHHRGGRPGDHLPGGSLRRAAPAQRRRSDHRDALQPRHGFRAGAGNGRSPSPCWPTTARRRTEAGPRFPQRGSGAGLPFFSYYFGLPKKRRRI